MAVTPALVLPLGRFHHSQHPSPLAKALRSAKGKQLWQEFFAELGIKAAEPQSIKAKAKRAA